MLLMLCILCRLEMADDRFDVSSSWILYSVVFRALNAMPQIIPYFRIFTCTSNKNVILVHIVETKEHQFVTNEYLLNEFFSYFERKKHFIFFILNMFSWDFVILCRSTSVRALFFDSFTFHSFASILFPHLSIVQNVWLRCTTFKHTLYIYYTHTHTYTDVQGNESARYGTKSAGEALLELKEAILRSISKSISTTQWD